MIFHRDRLFLIAGPCVIEHRDLVLSTAKKLAEISKRLSLPVVFKASFDKANRSSIHGFRGVGLEAGLAILSEVKRETGLPVLSDVHTPDQVAPAAKALDALQIPAFLARQTDLLIEAGRAKIPVNIKKGQFMAPHEMENALAKFRESGGTEAALTERGSSFGYGNLVVDFRSIAQMKAFGVPYIFDATHSMQLPAARGNSSGGDRRFLPALARAQIAAGADGLFMEVHPEPAKALSDKETQWPLDQLEPLLVELLEVYKLAKTFRHFEVA
ncbi:MAG: 3-deoxy-8-phosphooctulonate synthase [Spirochaetes bacterium]|nr:3-deoxy-8-phosphooctulonate synthase [Spirochaetota bacterium]